MIQFMKNDNVLPIIFSAVYFLVIFLMLYKNTVKYKAPVPNVESEVTENSTGIS